MKRLILLGLLVNLWPGTVSGQPLQSEDLHRPLVPEQLPSLESYIAVFPEWEESKLNAHLKLLKGRRYVFSVRNRDAWGQGFYIKKIMEAVNSIEGSRDPYAWHLLGAYYALAHELSAATEANREALSRIGKLREERGLEAANHFLGDLELRCRANLSRLLTSQDRPKDALAELGESLPKEGSPILRHALITAGVLAFLELEEIEAADELLAMGEGELPTEGQAKERFSEDKSSYPQFGSDWHEQTLPYLRARRYYAAEIYDQAVEGLKPFDGPSTKAKFWEARFLLGLATWKAGQPKVGAEVLVRLEQDLPKTIRGRPKGKMQRPELLWYNLGLIHEQMDESPPQEGRDYQRALQLTIDRDCRVFKELIEVESAQKCNLMSVCESLTGQARFLAEELENQDLSRACKGLCSSFEVSPQPVETPAEKILCQALTFEPFSAAFNNLGLLYLRRAREEKVRAAASPTVGGTNMTPGALLTRAKRVLEKGLVGSDTAQHWRLRLNLFLVEVERSDFDAAVIEARKVAEESSEHQEEVAVLVSDVLSRDEGFRSTETALNLFLDLATKLSATEMPSYLTSILAPMASGAPGWTHVSETNRSRAAALLGSQTN